MFSLPFYCDFILFVQFAQTRISTVAQNSRREFFAESLAAVVALGVSPAFADEVAAPVAAAPEKVTF